MPNLIAHLEPERRRQLADDLNYLNLGELRGFCKAHGVPFTISVETRDGGRKSTRDTDRKSVVLERVRAYLDTGRVPPPTCFRAEVVATEALPEQPSPDDRLYYGWYDKHHVGWNRLLARLTGGTFRDGAVARILARDFWTAGEAPTFAAFAEAWLEAERKGLGVDRGEHPEAAWLTDRARGTAGSDWKQKRSAIAARALATLDTIARPDRDASRRTDEDGAADQSP